jgi:hypothetical protein
MQSVKRAAVYVAPQAFDTAADHIKAELPGELKFSRNTYSKTNLNLIH